MHRSVLFSSVLAVALAAPAPALADPPSNTGAADALFQSAKAAMSRGDFATACAQLTESLHLDPQPGTMLNLADCEDRRGQVATALGYFEEARRRLVPGDYRIPFAEQRIAALGKRVPRLSLRLADGVKPEDVRVQRDGVALAETSLGIALPVDPGVHVCVVSAPGHEDARVEVTLQEGDARAVELALGPRVRGPAEALVAPAASLAASPAPQPRDEPPAENRGGTQRSVGVALGLAGIAGLGLGSVFGVLSKSTYDGAVKHCPTGPTSCDGTGTQQGGTAYGQAAISTASFIAGGVLLAAGATLYLTAPRVGAVTVSPSIGASFAGISFKGGF
jgi:hypothetical protein